MGGVAACSLIILIINYYQSNPSVSPQTGRKRKVRKRQAFARSYPPSFRLSSRRDESLGRTRNTTILPAFRRNATYPGGYTTPRYEDDILRLGMKVIFFVHFAQSLAAMRRTYKTWTRPICSHFLKIVCALKCSTCCEIWALCALFCMLCRHATSSSLYRHCIFPHRRIVITSLFRGEIQRIFKIKASPLSLA